MPNKATIKRGTILPDLYDDQKDGWLVLDVGKRHVEAVDLVFLCVWRWTAWAGDGIRVDQAMPRRDPVHESDWVGRAITLYPAPEAITEYLRRKA